MSEEFLKKHAYDLGGEAVREARLNSEFRHDCLQDDYVPGIMFHPGAGYQAAMATGGNLIFAPGTDKHGASYITDRPIKDPHRIQPEKIFKHDNQWVKYAIEFWKGVESQDLSGLCVTPRYNRSPLDLAWDLRGDELFYDFYDCPEQVAKMVELCAESIIEIDKILRSEISVLRDTKGGALGISTTKPIMLLNGDPLDLISEKAVKKFNNPAMEMIADYSNAVILHHHSIGISKAKAVNEIKNLTVQEICQDPKGPKIADSISEELIETSLKTPIFLEFPAADIYVDRLDEIAENLSRGRFIVHLWTENIDEARYYLSRIQ